MSVYDDPLVREAQEWVNDTYAGVPGYVSCPEDGQTGWQTMYALTRGLQHELGISTLTGSFGPATTAALDAHGPISASTTANILKIVQGACFAKGYHAGSLNGLWDHLVWGRSTATAVHSLMSDLGLEAFRDGTLKPKVLKALLTMDAYVLTSGGKTEVRAIQRWLNANYWQKTFASIVPCDGHYSRDVQQGLMKAIQSACGIADSVINGNFGPATRLGLQNNEVQPGATGLFVRLLSAACVFNGLVPTDQPGVTAHTTFKDTFDAGLGAYLEYFQTFSMLPKTGVGDYATWCDLLVSSGDPDRAAAASDTRFTISLPMATALAASGYKTVGRYVSNDPNGWDKQIKPGELEDIFDGGMKVFPIFQLNGRQLSDFTYETGRLHGSQAHERLVHYGFNRGTIIYFAVDYDATNQQITSNILPYFRGVQASLAAKGRRYRAGVYGSRNVCTRVSQETLAVSSFVSGMSWGFSGNLGFPLPFNWAFNQIKEFVYTGGGETIDLDRNVHRTEIDPGVGRNGVGGTPPPTLNTLLDLVDDVYAEAVAYGGSSDPNERTLEFLRSPRYTGIYKGWELLLPYWEVGWLRHAESLFGTRRDAAATFIDPTYGDHISLDHLAATANAVLVKDAGVGSSVTRGDFGGWGGDLATFYAEWRNSASTYSSGAAFAADRLAIRGVPSSWSFEDTVEDVDGHRLGLACRAGATFPAALRAHLTGSSHGTRFGDFYASRFGSSLSATKAAVRAMLVDDTGDAVLNTLREGAIAQTAPPFFLMPGQIPSGQLDSFIDGVADRFAALAAVG